MLIRTTILCSMVLAPSSASAAARAAERYSSPPGYQIVIATVDDLEAAEAEAERAARLLNRGVQPIGAWGPTPDSRSWDDTISVHETGTGLFEIIGGAGSEASLRKTLAEVARHFPSARLEASPNVHDGYHLLYSRRGILVGGSYRSYDAAIAAATDVAARSGLPFDKGGMVFDDDRGLIFPDSHDGPDAGRYLNRRYDECGRSRQRCITIERSESYGFEPGYLIVVAGVLNRGDERDRRLAALRAIVPDAYVKEANLWMGCRH